MKQPFQQFFSADKIKIVTVTLFLGLLLVLLGYLVGILLRQSDLQLSHRFMQIRITPTSLTALTASTEMIPTEDCGSPTLLLGTTLFQIQNLTRDVDGSLAVPADTSGIAYRVAGTDPSPVFVLSPTPLNITVMSTISIGSSAIASEGNCIAITYNLSAPQAATLNGAMFVSKSAGSITIFFPTISSGAGFVFKGTLVQ
jgi:hypothetical protein